MDNGQIGRGFLSVLVVLAGWSHRVSQIRFGGTLLFCCGKKNYTLSATLSAKVVKNRDAKTRVFHVPPQNHAIWRLAAIPRDSRTKMWCMFSV